MAGGHVIAKQPNQTSVHTPAAATKATVTVNGTQGVTLVCDSITATLACDSTAQTPLTVSLKDGTNVIWAGTVSAPANDVGGFALPGLEIPGTPGSSMTLEFSGAGVTGSVQAVTLGYHSLV